MYSIEIKPKFCKKVNKIKGKHEQINLWKKMNEIAKTLESNPNHYKNLHKPMQEYKRVHVNNSFVLIFLVDQKNNKVTFYNYESHDKIYKDVI